MTDGPRSAIISVSLALLRLHVSVDRIGDGCIGAACFVLVDDRGALAVVAHPRHQVSESHAAPGRPRVPRVPEIMEMQAFRADRADGVRPGRLPVEVPAAQRYARGAGKTSAPGSVATKTDRCSRRAGMIARGMPTIRRPALDLGGPRTI